MGMYPRIYTGIGININSVIKDEEQKRDFIEESFDKNPTKDIEFVWGEGDDNYLMIIISLDESATESFNTAEIKELDFDELEKIRHEFLDQCNSLKYEYITRSQIKLITGAFWR